MKFSSGFVCLFVDVVVEAVAVVVVETVAVVVVEAVAVVYYDGRKFWFALLRKARWPLGHLFAKCPLSPHL